MEPLNLRHLNISSLNPAAICFLNVDCRQYPRAPITHAYISIFPKWSTTSTRSLEI